MSKPLKRMANSSGQMILEMILLMTILISLTLLTARYFKDNELIAGLITGPWSQLAGMIQNGVWMPQGAADSYHPNLQGRAASLEGSAVK